MSCYADWLGGCEIPGKVSPAKEENNPTTLYYNNETCITLVTSRLIISLFLITIRVKNIYL